MIYDLYATYIPVSLLTIICLYMGRDINQPGQGIFIAFRYSGYLGVVVSLLCIFGELYYYFYYCHSNGALC